ncbi:hypothetical protein [Paludisphaera soli]|uniref:hypothetical protein n=1 Tax=Paludisphaera soli TaxID=2712865 RepID=UPI0013EA7C10|nr:hypothetical protein [Paludisphaera soli]
MGGDRPDHRGRRPKSLSRWLRLTLAANGVHGEYPIEDVIDIAGMLVATGRAVHPAKWVDALVHESTIAALGV